ncbi:MAG: DNRLRE domain-containing protein [Candidatus Schekmanbacteria bacterium]|nr:DNRLRE domain-containing protein [Candidatus Schekmanbacteria bacterium]
MKTSLDRRQGTGRLTSLHTFSLLALAALSGTVLPLHPAPPAAAGAADFVTVTYQNGMAPDASYGGAADTFLTTWNGNTSANLGGSDHLWLSRQGGATSSRPVIGFALDAGIPDGAHVESAFLELYAYDGGYDGGARTATAHLCLQPWIEGTGTDLFATDPNGATWIEAQPEVPWVTPGGTFDVAPLDSVTVGSDPDGWVRLDVTAAVRAWHTGTTPNYGIVIDTPDGDWLYHELRSSEFAVAAQRPRLVVTYDPDAEPVPLPPIVSLTSPVSGMVYQAPATITVAAEARDEDGTVQSVSFASSAGDLGAVSVPPYTVKWAGVAAGTYDIWATATDDGGLLGVSQTVTIRVVDKLAFALSLDPAAVTLAPSQAATVDVTITRDPGFAEPVTISVDNAPAGVQVDVAPEVVPPDRSNAVISLAAAGSAAPGQYTLTVSALSDTAAQAASLLLTVSDSPEQPGFQTHPAVTHRGGQSFVTWTENAAERGEHYRVYRHWEPITAQNLTAARLLRETPEGTSRFYADSRVDYASATGWAPRYLEHFVIEDGGSELADGVGLLVWTVDEQDVPAGQSRTGYYAVTYVSPQGIETFANGDASAAISGESVAAPVPVRVAESAEGGVLFLQYMNLAAWNPTFHAPHEANGYYGYDPADPAVAEAIQYAYTYTVGRPSASQCGGSVPASLPVVVLLHGWAGDTYAADWAGSHYYCALEIRPIDVSETWFFGFARETDYRSYAAPQPGDQIANFTEQRVLRMVYDLLRDGELGTQADPRRVYVYGGSMGGSGALAFALRYPTVFAAAYAAQGMTSYATSGDAGGTDWRLDVAPKWGDPADDLPVSISAPADWATSLARFNGTGVWSWQNHQRWIAAPPAGDVVPFGVTHGMQDNVIEWETQGQPLYGVADGVPLPWGGAVTNDGHTWPGFIGLPPTLAVNGALTPFQGMTVVVNETVPAFSGASGNLASPPAQPGSYNHTLEWSASWHLWDLSPVDEDLRWEMSIRTTDGSRQTVDVTPQRTSRFQPAPETAVSWTAYAIGSGEVLAQGSALAGDGGRVTVPAVPVDGTGTRLVLEVAACTAAGAPVAAVDVREPGGADRGRELVRIGVPLPYEAGATAPAGWAVIAPSGAVVPSQFTVRATWGPSTDVTAPARWVDGEFVAEPMTAWSESRYQIVALASNTCDVAPIDVQEASDRIAIDTGAARFEVSTARATVLGEIRLAGTAGAIAGAGDSGDGGIAIRTVGGETLISSRDAELLSTEVVRRGAAAVTLHQRLAFSDPRLVDERRGTDRSEVYTSGVPWLYAESEAYGQRLWIDVWSTFTRGSATAHLRVSIRNPNTCLVKKSGNIECGSVSSLNSVYVGDLAVRLPVRLAADGSGALSYASGEGSGQVAERVVLAQHGSGLDGWQYYAQLAGEWERNARHLQYRGYRLDDDGETVASGDQSAGWLALGDAAATVGLGVADAWKRFPVVLRGDVSASVVEAALLPQDDWSEPHSLRAGEARTYDVMISVGGAEGAMPAPSAMATAQTGLQSPLRWHLDDSTWIGSGLVPEFASWGADEAHDLWNEVSVNVELSRRNAAGSGYSPSSLVESRERYHLWGADVAGYLINDNEQKTSTDLSKYSQYAGFLVQALRSPFREINADLGVPLSDAWWELAVDAGRAQADTGYLVQPFMESGSWYIGVNFAHCYHEQSMALDFPRGSGFGCDFQGDIRGLALLGFLTGYEPALEALKAHTRYVLNHAGVPAGGVGWSRGMATRLDALLAAYQTTGDAAVLEQSVALLAATGTGDASGYLQCPCPAASSGQYVELQTGGQFLLALVRWQRELAVLASRNLAYASVRDHVAAQVAAHAEWLASRVLIAGDAADEAFVPYWWYWNDTSGANGQASYSAYSLMLADGLAAAAGVTGSAAHSDAAARLYNGAVRHSFGWGWTYGVYSTINEAGKFATFGAEVVRLDSAASR